MGGDVEGCRCSIPGLPSEVEGDAEHDEMGAVGSGEAVSGKAELGEVVFIFDKRSDLGRDVITRPGEDIEARGKGGLGLEIPLGNIADVEADPESCVGFELILIAGKSDQGVEGQRMNQEVGSGDVPGRTAQCLVC